VKLKIAPRWLLAALLAGWCMLCASMATTLSAQADDAPPMSDMEQAVASVGPYLDAHQATFGGDYLDKGNHTYVVAFTDDPQPHLKELTALYRFPDRLRVRQVQYTKRQLETYSMSAWTAYQAAHRGDLSVWGVGPDFIHNQVDLRVTSPDSAAVRELERRYPAGLFRLLPGPAPVPVRSGPPAFLAWAIGLLACGLAILLARRRRRRPRLASGGESRKIASFPTHLG
jgi:hypothetical protein